MKVKIGFGFQKVTHFLHAFCSRFMESEGAVHACFQVKIILFHILKDVTLSVHAMRGSQGLTGWHN